MSDGDDKEGKRDGGGAERLMCREKLECGGALKGMRAPENIWKRTAERVTRIMGDIKPANAVEYQWKK